MEKSNKTMYFTTQELAEIARKLDYLKTVRRAEISEQIKQARAFGDISENAEYDEAKNDQAETEGEIAKLEDYIRNAEIIDNADVNTGVVGISTLVKVQDEETGELLSYQIVGSMMSNDSDEDEGESEVRRITNDAPVARALIGKQIGQTAEVQAPIGIIKLKVLEITR